MSVGRGLWKGGDTQNGELSKAVEKDTGNGENNASTGDPSDSSRAEFEIRP